MLSRRSMVAAILGVPQLARATIQGTEMILKENLEKKSDTMPDFLKSEGPDVPPIKEEYGFTSMLRDALRDKMYEEHTDDYDRSRVIERDRKFQAMKSWSGTFRDSVILQNHEERMWRQRRLHEAFNNADLKTLIKLARYYNFDYRKMLDMSRQQRLEHRKLRANTPVARSSGGLF
jgi:hypothetical protein